MVVVKKVVVYSTLLLSCVIHNAQNEQPVTQAYVDQQKEAFKAARKKVANSRSVKEQMKLWPVYIEASKKVAQAVKEFDGSTQEELYFYQGACNDNIELHKEFIAATKDESYLVKN